MKEEFGKAAFIIFYHVPWAFQEYKAQGHQYCWPCSSDQLKWDTSVSNRVYGVWCVAVFCWVRIQFLALQLIQPTVQSPTSLPSKFSVSLWHFLNWFWLLEKKKECKLCFVRFEDCADLVSFRSYGIYGFIQRDVLNLLAWTAPD